MSISRILMDPDIYEEPYSFRPERWNEGTKEQQARLASFFVPFGRGARMCVGIKYVFCLICSVHLVISYPPSPSPILFLFSSHTFSFFSSSTKEESYKFHLPPTFRLVPAKRLTHGLLPQ